MGAALWHWMGLNSTTLTRFSVRNAAPDFEALARPNITISCCAPHWSTSATARCCRCARNLSPRKTAIKNRTAKPKPPTAGSIKTQRATHPCVRFTLGDDLYANQPMCEKVTQAGDDFIFRVKEGSHKTLFSYLDGVTWPTKRVVKKTPGRKQPNLIYQYRIARAVADPRWQRCVECHIWSPSVMQGLITH